MRQLYYIIQTLLRGRASNMTKIVSLTLGLFVGILLFARVAFELSFDGNYREAENICVVNANYVIGGEKRDPVQVVMGPVPRTIGEAFPQEIESHTIVVEWDGGNTLFNGDVRTQPKMILADSLFFQTLGIDVLRGDPRELGNPDVVFLSENYARRSFGEENPIGKTLLYNKLVVMTVKGVYEDVSENSSLQHDVVISFASIAKYNWMYTGWDGGDSFQGFIRLRRAADIDKVNARINQAIEAYMPYKPESGFGVKYSLQPLRDVYTHSETVHKMILIMSLLATAILLIASLNYVLISISSLAQRSKAVGVHKCNGASGGAVFGMFFWETGILILFSLLLVGLIVINFREPIEDISAASLGALFTWRTLWLPASAVLFLFLVAGVLPGRMLARIPVTQLFRRYTDRKSGWKRFLLFVQFVGVTFIFGLLIVVLLQYHRVTDQDLGYTPDRVAYTYFYFPGGRDAGRDALRLLPMVEAVSVSGSHITSGYDGMPMMDDNGKVLFTPRCTYAAFDYTDFMGIKLTVGRQLRDSTECLVNEEFVHRMRWTDTPLGRQFRGITIVGVMRNFPVSSYYEAQQPVVIGGQDMANGCWHVRLKEPFDENLRALNLRLKEMFPDGDITFKSLPQAIETQYVSVRRFRDAVMLASCSILLIALMGLIGYVNDETRRRSKEIAIRKVNGAEASSILRLLSKDIVLTAIPATLIGAVVAYFMGKSWLEQFAEQIELNAVWFVLLVLAVLLVVVATVVSKGWRIANENPVNSIKSE